MKVYLIACANERQVERELYLKSMNIDNYTIVQGIVAKSKEEMNKCIFQSHYKAFRTHIDSGYDDHMLVLEDDCVFTCMNPLEVIKNKISYLEKFNWATLHVGHVPLLPTIPVGNGLVRSFMPFCGHAYVINGTKLNELDRNIDEESWGRPHFVEGMQKVNRFERFAMCPYIAYQSRMPREMKSIPFVGKYVSFYFGTRVIELLMLSIMPTIVLICVFLFIRYKFHY